MREDTQNWVRNVTVCSVTVARVSKALRGDSTVLRDKGSVVNHCLGRTRGRKQVGRDGGVESDQGQGRV